MTVTYSSDVATSSVFSYFRILFRWRGSLWKSVIVEMIVWCICYFTLKIVYTYAMDESQRETFEDIAVFCNTYSNLLPITFMLGFYVTTVFNRWQKYFDCIGWIDTPALAIATHVKGTTETARQIRRNMIRYLIFVQAIIFRDISVPVRTRYPTVGHLVKAGFISEEELACFDSLQTGQTKYYLPISWSLSLLVKAREMGLVDSDQALIDVTDKIYHWRETIVSNSFSNWVQVPLAYTQAGLTWKEKEEIQMIHLAVFSFYLIAIMGRQFIHPKRTIPGFVQPVDPIVPVASLLELLFILGWTKMTEIMLNPMGEDDDDFETNFMLERNLRVGMALADSHFGVYPQIKKDIFWGQPITELRKEDLPKATVITNFLRFCKQRRRNPVPPVTSSTHSSKNGEYPASRQSLQELWRSPCQWMSE